MLILLQTLEKVLYDFVLFINASQSTFIILGSSHTLLLSVIVSDTTKFHALHKQIKLNLSLLLHKLWELLEEEEVEILMSTSVLK